MDELELRPTASLSRILDDLGRTFLVPLAVPPGPDPEIGSIVVYDPHDVLAVTAGDLILAVGVREEQVLADLLTAAGKHRAAAVIAKWPATPSAALIQTARDASVSLLGVAGVASWAQLASLLHSSIAGARDGGIELAGVAAGDLFALVNAVSALLDAPVTLEDLSSRVLAFSGRQDEADEPRIATILGRQVPVRYTSALAERGVFRQLYQSTEPILIDALDGTSLPRVAIAIRAGDELLATMWVATRIPLTAERMQALTESARLAALHLLRHRSADDGRKVRNDLVAAVLAGGADGRSAVRRLGISGHRFCVVALRVAPRRRPSQELRDPHDTQSAQPNADADAQIQSTQQRYSDALAVHLAAVQEGSAVGVVAGLIYAIVPITQRKSSVTGAETLRAVQDFLNRVGDSSDLIAGWGRIVDSLSDIGRSRREADRALRVLEIDPRQRTVVSFEQVYVESLLIQLAELIGADDAITTGPVRAVQRYDAEHGTALLQTAVAYLDSLGSVNRAAAALGVRPTTFRYRLNRFGEISGLALEDSKARLDFQLQLRLQELGVKLGY
jgi:DNA-binding PucR family transcriptional regulator